MVIADSAQERAAWYRELVQLPVADVEAALPLMFTGARSKEVRPVPIVLSRLRTSTALPCGI